MSIDKKGKTLEQQVRRKHGSSYFILIPHMCVEQTDEQTTQTQHNHSDYCYSFFRSFLHSLLLCLVV